MNIFMALALSNDVLELVFEGTAPMTPAIVEASDESRDRGRGGGEITEESLTDDTS